MVAMVALRSVRAETVCPASRALATGTSADAVGGQVLRAEAAARVAYRLDDPVADRAGVERGRPLLGQRRAGRASQAGMVQQVAALQQPSAGGVDGRTVAGHQGRRDREQGARLGGGQDDAAGGQA